MFHSFFTNITKLQVIVLCFSLFIYKMGRLNSTLLKVPSIFKIYINFLCCIVFKVLLDMPVAELVTDITRQQKIILVLFPKATVLILNLGLIKIGSPIVFVCFVFRFCFFFGKMLEQICIMGVLLNHFSDTHIQP